MAEKDNQYDQNRESDKTGFDQYTGGQVRTRHHHMGSEWRLKNICFVPIMPIVN